MFKTADKLFTKLVEHLSVPRSECSKFDGENQNREKR